MILDDIVSSKKKRVTEAKQRVPMETLVEKAGASAPTRDFAGALSALPGVNLIAEVKQASPSAGIICEDFHPVEIAKGYEAAGAAAISVLTEKDFFQGSLSYLSDIRDAVGLPLLCKDFFIDTYQILEARAAGADAILLIVAILTDEEIAEFQRHAADLGMAAIVEVHSEEEMKRAVRAESKIIGINNRDLRTFEVNLETTSRLAQLAPSGTVLVGESGINSRTDVTHLEATGINAILVGESLMKSNDVSAKIKELLG